MPRKIESLFLTGPAGRLEALLEEPDVEPSSAALVCHPHPRGGGTMHNKVVYRIARGLRRHGSVVLRFNYRGVNLSEGAYDGGRGETDDAGVAVEHLRSRYPGVPAFIAGFSFGSRIALRVAAQRSDLDSVLAVGFPTSLGEFGYLSHVAVPKHFIQSTNDEFGPQPQFSAFYAGVSEPKHLEWIEAEDHFFKNSLDAFEAAVERFALLRSKKPVSA